MTLIDINTILALSCFFYYLLTTRAKQQNELELLYMYINILTVAKCNCNIQNVTKKVMLLLPLSQPLQTAL